MPNTTNYSFPTPADTDLVKNGADAIRDLGDAVDTAMNTALGTKKSGLVLLNTTSFSAVASQSISDVFSATYDNYRIILDVTSNVNTALSMRMRVAGSDNSTSNYNVQYASVDNTTLSAGRIATGTSWNMNGGQGTARCFYGLTLLNPFATQFTGVYMENSLRYDANLLAVGFQALGFAATTSFTGFTLFPVGGASPTISGTLSVYGFNK
jgi:hypothetical protein